MARELAELVEPIADEGIPSRYDCSPSGSRSVLEAGLTTAITRIESKLPSFYDRFPTASSDDLIYSTTDNSDGWTTSFWTGQCWLAYELTGEDRFRDAAEAQLGTFTRRLEVGEVRTHDLGFLYSLSAVAGYQLTGKEEYRSTAIAAAELLCGRFWSAPGFIQAWGDLDHPDANEWALGRMIVDTMMNLPLLFWAGEVTDDDSFAAMAETHARTTARHIVRQDGSTYHTFQFDVESGAPLGGETHQGYDDESCWARGQAWALYGYALASEYTNEAAYAGLAAKLANYYLQRVESDYVPRWDFDVPNHEQIRDSSAAAISACGLLQLASTLPAADVRGRKYQAAALEILESLTNNYITDAEHSNGILSAGAYDRTEGEYNECCIWGDYFYVEGLVRATEFWTPYW